jgi:hypothetical protein
MICVLNTLGKIVFTQIICHIRYVSYSSITIFFKDSANWSTNANILGNIYHTGCVMRHKISHSSFSVMHSTLIRFITSVSKLSQIEN